MTLRRQSILQHIADEYIQTAEPVGSKLLADYLGFSSATIRAEMSSLEKDGYIHQPHTSAGRVPTEKGYRYYIDHLGLTTTISKEDIKSFAENKGIERFLKVIANKADGNTAFCVTPDSIHYAGLADTFRKREFENQEIIVRFAQLLDNLGDFVRTIEFDTDKTVKTYIGHENPYKFAQDFSTIAVFLPFGSKPCVVGILGPMRMPYKKIIPYVSYIADIFKHRHLLR